ncbi:MAG TPA: LLM class flavin-dependent oxidoreductase [Acidimicrobiales bacterium]|nr:LLM class flavin-dependent oxidoreductase [Acidimicrobiales bacterium]
MATRVAACRSLEAETACYTHPMALEMWTLGAGVPKAGTRYAQRVEADGWDGLLMVDSQNLSADCFVGLALAAKATDRLKLGTGVTNPWTRHPAVTAAAIATVQAESDGRAVLGIGRGDSALAHLGLAPAPVAVFRRFLEQLQAYLRGEEVDLATAAGGSTPSDTDGAPRPVDSLGLAGTPPSSRLHWLRPELPKVPVDVACTGPKVIAVGATIADRVTFAVGADPHRVEWALSTARAARRAAGLDPDGVSYGAYVNCVAHPDPETARRLGEGGLASFARFSVMHGTVSGPADDVERQVFGALHDAYDMRVHTRSGTPQAAALTDEFVDRYAVFGPPDYCVGRLRELASLGLDRIAVIGPSLGADRADVEVARERFAAEVLPAMR